MAALAVVNLFGMRLDSAHGFREVRRNLAGAIRLPQHLGAQPVAVLDEQVVIGRDKELGRAGIALPSGSADELPIDATAVVLLGGDDVQATSFESGRVRFDVGAASGHVGGNRDGSAVTGLRDDLRLVFRLYSVEQSKWQASFGQRRGDAFAGGDRACADQHRPAVQM